MRTKILCIYHSVDLDGWMSAAIVMYRFFKTYDKVRIYDQTEKNLVDYVTNSNPKDDITIIMKGWNYGDPIPDTLEFETVIMCDVSFTKEEMLKIYNHHSDHFIWIDHHISAIKDNDCHAGYCKFGENYNLYVNGSRLTEYSACELTWNYFFPLTNMPKIVNLLGKYDTFRHKGSFEELEVNEFQYGARELISNVYDAYKYLWESLNIPDIRDRNSVIKNIQERGKIIYSYLKNEALKIYENRFDIIFFEDSKSEKTIGEEFKLFACVNRERFNPSSLGIDYHKDGYDGVACFWYNGKTNNYHFSLYNENGKVDCSALAKRFGGGGHKGASGFIVDKELFNHLMSISKYS